MPLRIWKIARGNNNLNSQVDKSYLVSGRKVRHENFAATCGVF
jgi:hypothetical protein